MKKMIKPLQMKIDKMSKIISLIRFIFRFDFFPDLTIKILLVYFIFIFFKSQFFLGFVFKKFKTQNQNY